MSRYKCPPCEREWSTENMAPVCGDCFYKQRQELEALRAEAKRYRDALEKIAQAPRHQSTSDFMGAIADSALPQSPGEEGKRG